MILVIHMSQHFILLVDYHFYCFICEIETVCITHTLVSSHFPDMKVIVTCLTYDVSISLYYKQAILATVITTSSSRSIILTYLGKPYPTVRPCDVNMPKNTN